MFGYACDRCREKHQSCNHELPCKRCIKANVADTCHYTPKRTRSKNPGQALKTAAGMHNPSARVGPMGGFPHGLHPAADPSGMYMGYPGPYQLGGMMDHQNMMGNVNISSVNGGSSNPGTPFNPAAASRFPVPHHHMMNPGSLDPNLPFPGFPPHMMFPPHPSMMFPFPPGDFQKQQFVPTMIPHMPFLPAQFFPVQQQGGLSPLNIPGGAVQNQGNFPPLMHNTGMPPSFSAPGTVPMPHNLPLPMMPQMEVRRSITPTGQAAIHSSNVSLPGAGECSSPLDRISLPTMDHRLSQSGLFLPPPEMVSAMPMMHPGAQYMPAFVPNLGLPQRKSNSALGEALLFHSDVPQSEDLQGGSSNPSESMPSNQIPLPGFNQGYTFPPLASDGTGGGSEATQSAQLGIIRGHTVPSTSVDSSLSLHNNKQLDNRVESTSENANYPLDSIPDANSSASGSSPGSVRDENRGAANVVSYNHGENERMMVKDILSSMSTSASMSRLLNADLSQPGSGN